jgi:ferric hydroxamate transport system substrate-binding protein
VESVGDARAFMLKPVSRREWMLASAAAMFMPLAFGTPLEPRIACFDWALAETLLALGVEPIGVVAANDWSRFVVEPVLPRRTADLGLQQEINFELLAELRPELILVSPFLANFEPQLRTIAQTLSLSVYEDNGPPLAQREAVMRTLASRVRRTAVAERYLAEASQTFDATRQRLAKLPIRPLLLATFVDARHVRVYGGSSLHQNVLARIGVANAWTRRTSYFGYTTVGIEELATERDVHLITFDPLPPDVKPILRESPLWSRLPFVRSGHVSTLPPTLMFGGMPAAVRFTRLLAATLESGVT